MGYAKLYAKTIKKEAGKPDAGSKGITNKENLWSTFFERLWKTIPKGFYQYLEKQKLKDELHNKLEEKAEKAYRNNTVTDDELRAALTNLESFYNKQINAYLVSKQDKHRLQSSPNKL